MKTKPHLNCQTLKLCMFCRLSKRTRVILFKELAPEYEICPYGWTDKKLPSKEAIVEREMLNEYKKKNYPCCG